MIMANAHSYRADSWHVFPVSCATPHWSETADSANHRMVRYWAKLTVSTIYALFLQVSAVFISPWVIIWFTSDCWNFIPWSSYSRINYHMWKCHLKHQYFFAFKLSTWNSECWLTYILWKSFRSILPHTQFEIEPPLLRGTFVRQTSLLFTQS